MTFEDEPIETWHAVQILWIINEKQRTRWPFAVNVILDFSLLVNDFSTKDRRLIDLFRSTADITKVRKDASPTNHETWNHENLENWSLL